MISELNRYRLEYQILTKNGPFSGDFVWYAEPGFQKQLMSTIDKMFLNRKRITFTCAKYTTVHALDMSNSDIITGTFSVQESTC